MNVLRIVGGLILDYMNNDALYLDEVCPFGMMGRRLFVIKASYRHYGDNLLTL